MKIVKKITSLILSVFLISGCQQNQEFNRDIYAMDTYINVSIYGNNDSLLEEVENKIYELENLLSITKTSSDIYKINNRTISNVTVDMETANLISDALTIAKETNGAFDSTIYPALTTWGFTTDNYHIASEEELNNLKNIIGYNKVNIQKNVISLPTGMQIDLGGIAKGYTSDLIIDYLKGHDIDSALINIGGNVQTLGRNNNGELWKIGIYSPVIESDFGIVNIEDKAVITSGLYERYFVGEDGNTYGHILDPNTLLPVNNDLLSVTVVCDDGKLGDALSTALFVMVKDEAYKYWQSRNDFEAIFLTKDNQAFITEGLSNSFELTDSSKDMKLEVMKR